MELGNITIICFNRINVNIKENLVSVYNTILTFFDDICTSVSFNYKQSISLQFFCSKVTGHKKMRIRNEE